MGLDCPNIGQIIHLGPARGMEEYIQEVGRGGCDGHQTRALCINVPTGNTEKTMKEYINNKSTCRRIALFEDTMGTFTNIPLTLCKCCDICVSSCMCGDCTTLNSIIQ